MGQTAGPGTHALPFSKALYIPSKLYQIPASERPDTIVVIGDGLSVYWLCKHFPDKLIACISKEDPNRWFDVKNEKRPPNLRNYPAEMIDEGRVEIYASPTPGNVILESHDNRYTSFEGFYCCDLGLIKNTEVTKVVPESQLLVYPEKSHIGFIYNTSSYTAPEDTPLGSLAEASVRWGDATGNLKWSSSYFCFHDGYYLADLAAEMKKEKIEFDNKLFRNLKELIKGKSDQNPLVREFRSSPNMTKIIQVYQQAIKLH